MMQGMGVEAWVAALAAAIAILGTRRAGWSPITVSLWLWVAVFAALAWGPLQLNPVTYDAAVIASVGLAALAAPTILSRDKPLPAAPQGDRRVAVAHLMVCSVTALAMATIGTLAFRSGVAATAGVGYDSLTLQQVRAAQTGAARGGGILSLFASATPIVSCLGMYGWLRFSRAWLLLTAAAFALVMQTPARLTIISLIVITATFYLYARRTLRPDTQRRTRRQYVAMAAAGALGLVIFTTVGADLGKNTLFARYVPNYTGPSWLLDPLAYFTGGVPAMSYAVDAHLQPLQPLTSVYTLTRAAQVIDPSLEAPDTLGVFVRVPMPFNVYTGFGQTYFDFGLAGVAIMCGILGWAALTAHRRAKAGQVEWAWAAAVLASLLLSLPQAYRLFFLDVDFQLVVGAAMLLWVRKSRRRTQLSGPACARPAEVRSSATPLPRSH